MADETRKLFGTDGIRGVANREPMTAEMALRLGQAVAQTLSPPAARRAHRDRQGHAALGLHARERAAGGHRLGGRRRDAGRAAARRPGIAFITSSMRADAGVVISASHNPYQDNGIKIFAADGFKLPDEVEAEIERRMAAIGGGNDGARAAPDAIGKAERIEDALGRYVQFLKHAFPKELTLDGVKVVVDCANGAAYHVAPQVFASWAPTVDRAQRLARRAEHQRRVRRAAPRDDGGGGAAVGRADRHRARRRRRPRDPRRRARARSSTAIRSWRSWGRACSRPGSCRGRRSSRR